jgi:hypothetical protein
MGALDALLDHAQPLALELTIRCGNREQADLVAMHRGYRAQFEDSDTEGWVYLKLTQVSQSIPA